MANGGHPKSESKQTTKPVGQPTGTEQGKKEKK